MRKLWRRAWPKVPAITPKPAPELPVGERLEMWRERERTAWAQADVYAQRADTAAISAAISALATFLITLLLMVT